MVRIMTDENETEERMKIYSYPLIGVVFGLEPGRVLMRYQLKMFSFDENGVQEHYAQRLTVAENEEKADELMKRDGLIMHKEHLHQELQKLEDARLESLSQEGEALSATIEDNE